MARVARGKGRDSWYSGAHYKIAQPFVTFVKKDINNRLMVADRLKSLVGNTRNKTALEIGPGDAPIISMLSFGKRFYVDISEGLAKKLRKTGKPKHRVAVGDIRSLPFLPKKFFDVIAVNEVLTHVEEDRRLDVLKGLADRSNALVLVDRHMIPFRQYREMVRDIGRANLAAANLGYYYATEEGASKITLKRILRSKESWRRIANMDDEKLREKYVRLVDFARLKAFLQKNGWVTATQKAGVDYTILTAKRK